MCHCQSTIGEEGNGKPPHRIHFHRPKTWSPVSGFCYARNRIRNDNGLVCDRQWELCYGLAEESWQIYSRANWVSPILRDVQLPLEHSFDCNDLRFCGNLLGCLPHHILFKLVTLQIKRILVPYPVSVRKCTQLFSG